MVAIENMDVLRQNGFEVEDADDDEVQEMGSGGRLRLVAQPVSKSTEFDIKGQFLPPPYSFLRYIFV